MNADNIQFAVFHGSKEMTPEMHKEALAFVQYIKDLQKIKNTPVRQHQGVDIPARQR